MGRQAGDPAKSQAPGNLAAPGNKDVRYPTAQLLASKALSGYQRDFAKTLLAGPDYTFQEAKDILDRFFKGGDR